MNAQLILNEILDPQKVRLICDEHGYVAGSDLAKPFYNHHCKKCIMVDLIFAFANMPAGNRLERLDQLEAALRVSCELEEKGLLDIQFFERPLIEIIKEDA